MYCGKGRLSTSEYLERGGFGEMKVVKSLNRVMVAVEGFEPPARGL
jgi:hypothetical protein